MESLKITFYKSKHENHEGIKVYRDIDCVSVERLRSQQPRETLSERSIDLFFKKAIKLSSVK